MFAHIFYSNKDIYPLKHIFETLTLQLFHMQVSGGRCKNDREKEQIMPFPEAR